MGCFDMINDFDGVSRCACNGHNKFPNVLVITGSTFVIPSLILYEKEYKILSFNSFIVAMTSIFYHSTHSKFAKKNDVVAAYSLVICAFIQSLLQINVYFAHSVASILTALMIIVINNHSFFREGEITLLHFHVLIHLLGVSGLLIIAFSGCSGV